MSDLKLMPNHLDIREQTLTNLLLLGFDVEAKESEYRIPFSRDMFSTPNKKAMEVVLHFLFTKLNPSSAKEVFRNCWPIVEKKQEQEFRRVSIEWLTKIKGDVESPIPTVAPMLLLSPAGNRFYEFLFYFSLYVLKQKVSGIPKKFGIVYSRGIISAANKAYTHQLVKGLDVAFVNERKRMTDFLEETVDVKKAWIEYASELSKQHRKLNKERREWENKVQEIKQQMQLVLGKSVVSSKDILRRTQDLQNVKENWKTFSNFYETQKKLKEQVESVVNNNDGGYSLDGENIPFKLPDLLVSVCEQQLRMGKRYEDIYEGGKVDLVGLVQLWNLSLHLVKEAIEEYPLPNVEQDEAYIRVQAHNHANCLKSSISLRDIFNEQISDLKLSIKELKEKINENELAASEAEKCNLDILPSTPALFFGSTQDPRYDEIGKGPFSSEVATPDAVQSILLNIDKNTVMKELSTPINPLKELLSPLPVLDVELIEGKKQNIPNNKVTRIKTSKIPLRQAMHKQKENIKPVGLQKKENRKLAVSETCNLSNAQEILIEQISQFVTNNQIIPENASDDESQITLHALENPFEAFSTGAFIRQDKVVRTPVSEKPQEQCRTNQFSEFFTPLHGSETNTGGLDFSLLTPINKVEIGNFPTPDTKTEGNAINIPLFQPKEQVELRDTTSQKGCPAVHDETLTPVISSKLIDMSSLFNTPIFPDDFNLITPEHQERKRDIFCLESDDEL